jgi:hypothetical protein
MKAINFILCVTLLYSCFAQDVVPTDLTCIKNNLWFIFIELYKKLLPTIDFGVESGYVSLTS